MLQNSVRPARAAEVPPFSGVDFAGLGNRFIGLLGRKWSRRSFAAEMAKLLAQATRTRAVAVLAYERCGGPLAVLADYGLPGEARLAFGGTPEGGWELPLRSLEHRRISVIEAAHQNPLVPLALSKLSPDKLCIVCLPIYYGGEPAGAVVLFAPRHHAFSDAQLQILSQALRVCGRGLQPDGPAPSRNEMGPGAANLLSEPGRQIAPMAGNGGGAPPSRLYLVASQGADPLSATPLAAPPSGSLPLGGLLLSGLPLGGTLSDAERVQQEIARAQAELQRRSEGLRRLLTANHTLQAERDRLAQQLIELEKLRVTESTELQGSISNLEERLLAAESERLRAHRLAEEKQAAMESALHALQADHVAGCKRIEGLESRLAAASSLTTAITQERDGLASRLQELESLLERAVSEREQAMKLIREGEKDQEILRGEIAALGEQLRERDGVIQTAAAEAERLTHQAHAAEGAAAAAARERDELRQAVEEAVTHLEHERLARAAELQALLQELRPEISGDEAQLDANPPALAADTGLATAPTPDALVIERSAPLGAEGLPDRAEDLMPLAPANLDEPAGELVLLDDGAVGERACAALAAAGVEATPQSLDEAAAAEWAGRNLKCILLNLGAGISAWRALRQLRQGASTRHVPILAYAAEGQASTGFCLGRVDFALWPLEPGRMIECLGRLRPKLQRLLVVSTDIDGMGELREPLARARISSSLVLDAKQALELSSMVQPEAAVVHLSPACPSAGRAITVLRAQERTRDLPLLVLIDAAPVAGEEAFFATTSRHFASRPGFQLSHLPEEIGRLIG